MSAVAPAAFAVLALAALALMLLPVATRRRAAVARRGDCAVAVHRSRLEQLVRDRAEGRVDPAEAATTEAEIARALLAAAREAEREGPAVRARGSRAAMAGFAVLSLCAGVGVYALQGSWGAPDLPLAAREGAGGMTGVPPTILSEHEGTPMQEAIASLRSRIEADPQSAENWHLLARTYSVIEAYGPAAAAYEQLVALVPFDLDLRGDLGEALVRRDDGFVGPAAVAAFELVLGHAPEDPRALYYLALRDAQEGDDLRAARGWARILRTAPPDAPYLPAIRQILEAVIEDAGLDRAALDLPAPGAAPPLSLPLPETGSRGPTAEDMAAAAQMSEDDRLGMIRGMVAQLEARLEESPADVEGWLRLARSRAVLGEPEAAAAALERGLAANPGSEPLRTALASLRGESAPR